MRVIAACILLSISTSALAEEVAITRLPSNVEADRAKKREEYLFNLMQAKMKAAVARKEREEHIKKCAPNCVD